MFKERKFISEITKDAYLNYLEYVPADTSSKKPLVIHIHGAGSRGCELSKMSRVGPLRENLLNERKKENEQYST